MRELGSVGPGDHAEEDRLGINSYLQLIGDDGGGEKRLREARLPELTAQPWRISDIKNKMSRTAANSKTAGSKTVSKIGKLGSFAFQRSNSNLERQPKEESSLEVDTNKIKEMFEDNAKMGSKRTVSELNLGPVRRKKVVIEPPQQQQQAVVQRRGSVKAKAWSDKLASYWSNNKKEDRPDKSKPKSDTIQSEGKRPREEEAWKSI